MDGLLRRRGAHCVVRGGDLYCIDCAAKNPYCGWDPYMGWYDCGTAGGEDPSGDAPYDCLSCDPPCEAGFDCVDQECLLCEPSCSGIACGGDGCGGSCGECPPDLICSGDGQCADTPTCKVAQAIHCNETVTGNTLT